MENDNGRLSVGISLDTSQIDKDKKHVTDAFQEIGETAEKEGKVIDEAFGRIPKVDIDVSEARRNVDSLQQALTAVNAVIGENEKMLERLREEERRLGAEYSNTFQKNQQEADGFARQRDVIRENIRLREEVLQEAKSVRNQLESVRVSVNEEAKAVQNADEKHQSLRQRIKEVKQEMADAVLNGIDEQSEAYKRLVNELGRLQDIQSDIQQQGTILANDEAQFQGIISGISGISGAFSAATGAVSLFAGENEDLQKVMTKLQSVMAITMGLQQLQQTLNKDSAFQLVTLTNLRAWWNNLLEVGRGEQTAETEATVANTAAKATNTAAQTANNAAKTAAAGASAAATAATGAETAAIVGGTGAAVAGRVANIGLAGSIRMIGAAIKGFPVFGWIIAGISALIAVYEHFASKAEEASKKLKENQELLKESRKTYASASVTLQDYIRKIDTFNGTQEQEKHLVSELNTKYGETMGYHKTLAEWKDALKTKGSAYCEVLMLEAKAQATLNKYTEAYVNLLEVKEKAEKGEFDHWYNTKAGDERARQQAIDQAQADVDKFESQYTSLQKQIQNIKNANDLNYHADTTKPTKTGKSGSGFDANKAALAQKKAIDEYKQQVQKYLQDARQQISDFDLQKMADGQAKEIAQIDANVAKQIDEWDDKLRELAEARKKSEHDYFMSKKGATEEAWANSLRGKMTIEQYESELRADQTVNKRYQQVMTAIVDQGEREREQVRQKYTDQYVDLYGTTAQKIQKIERDWQKVAANIPEQFRTAAEQAKNAKIGELLFEEFKNDIDWSLIFGDLSKATKKQLQIVKQQILQFKKSDAYKKQSPEQIQVIEEALNKINDSIAERGGLFGGLIDSLEAYKKATEEVTAAQEAYNNAVTDAEKAAARLRLQQAKKNQQDAQTTRDKAIDSTTKKLEGLMSAVSDLGSASDMSIAGLGSAVSNVTGLFGEAAGKIGGIIGAILEILGSISESGGFGNFLENLFDNVFGAVGGIFSTLFGQNDLWGASYNADLVEELTLSNSNLEKAISRLTDTMRDQAGKDATATYERTKKAQEDAMRNTQKIMSETAKSYSNGFLGIGGSRSANAHINDSLSSADWQRISQIVGRTVRSASDLWKLSSEQMARIADQANDLWTKIQKAAGDGYKDVSSYMDQYIEYYEKLIELQNQYNETVTQLSFDTAKSDLESMLLDTENDMEKVMKNLSQYFQKAIVNYIVTSQMKDRLQNWYAQFATAMSDGILQEAEKAALNSAYEALYNEAAGLRDAAMKAAGIDFKSSSDSKDQEASRGGYETVSEDTGTALLGRETSMLMQLTRLADGFDEHFPELTQTAEEAITLASAMNEVMFICQGYLENISNNSDSLPRMETELHKIRQIVEQNS